MSKDLINDRYGRYYEIPEELHKLGNEVRGIAFSYKKSPPIYENSGLVPWVSIDMWPNPFNAAWAYRGQLELTLQEFKPEVIWACSDAPHVIAGVKVGHRYNIPTVIDLYDNYEAYGLTKIPGIRRLLRKACSNADGVTVIGKRLKHYIDTSYGVNCSKSYVLENAISADLFSPTDTQLARSSLGLPNSAKLIGTAGALYAGRGIEVLFEAFLRIAEDNSDTYLVIAGPRDYTPSRYRHDRIIDLGLQPLKNIPLVYSALDLAIICNKPSQFGEYCFPQKFYEIVACKTPVLAADVGEMSDLLSDCQELLFEALSVDSLVQAINRQLESPKNYNIVHTPDWGIRAKALESIFQKISRDQMHPIE